MNKIIIAIISISIAVTSSCSLFDSAVGKVKAEKASAQKPMPSKRAERKPVAGDTVIARWGPGHWAEGRVESINSSSTEAQIQWADGSSPSSVDIDEIFALPTVDSELEVVKGDYVLVRTSSDHWWSGAQVSDVGSTVIKAKVIYSGEVVNLPREKVLVVNDTVGAYIKDMADREDFVNRAHEHWPVRSEGFSPKPGDHILGEWTTNAWYGGKVKSVNGTRATIIWENGMKPDDAPFEKIVPFPTATEPGPVPSVNDFVLVRPSNRNPRAAWIYAQVTSVNGSTIEAKDVDQTRDYKAGDYIRLER